MFKKTTLIIPNSNLIGDNVVISPHVNYLIRKYPKNNVLVLSEKKTDELFKLLGFNTLCFDLANAYNTVFNNVEIDSVYNFNYTQKSYFLLKTLKYNKAYGFESCEINKNMCDEIYNEFVPIEYWTSEIRDVSCIETLGSIIKLNDPSYVSNLPSIKVKNSDIKTVSSFLSKGLTPTKYSKAIVTFFAGGGSEYKRWGILNFISLAKELQDNYLCIFIFGPKDDIVLSQYLANKNDLSAKMVKNFNIGQLAALYKMSSLNITNDSGPMHISCAVGCPTIVIFGTTNSKAWFPYNRIKNKVIENECASYVNCNTCPIDKECIKTIKIDGVESKISEIIN